MHNYANDDRRIREKNDEAKRQARLDSYNFVAADNATPTPLAEMAVNNPNEDSDHDGLTDGELTEIHAASGDGDNV